MDGWTTKVFFWDGLFSGAFAVSFREGNPLTWPSIEQVRFSRKSFINPQAIDAGCVFSRVRSPDSLNT